jgi:hypothetical protein
LTVISIHATPEWKRRFPEALIGILEINVRSKISPALEEHKRALDTELHDRYRGLNGAKVYGISADELKRVLSRDRVSAEKLAYAERPDPHFLTYGPKTRREFLLCNAHPTTPSSAG